jgi:D-alanyl-D-alanine carboxypeptidase (penicillin-binding protein 5/6)
MMDGKPLLELPVVALETVDQASSSAAPGILLRLWMK